MEFGEITNTQKGSNSQRRSGVEGPWDKVGTLEVVKIGHKEEGGVVLEEEFERLKSKVMISLAGSGVEFGETMEFTNTQKDSNSQESFRLSFGVEDWEKTFGHRVWARWI